MDFSSAGQYDVIYNHILTHKYFLNERQTDEIPLADAVLSWFDTVYMPIIACAKKYRIMKYVKKRTESDLYVWITRYYEDLKKRYSDYIPIDTVMLDLRNEYKFSFFKRLLNRIKKLFMLGTIKKCR